MYAFKNGALALAGLLAFCAHAQVTKPGLWESTTKVGGSPEMERAMMDMQKQIASMPAEQRKQMEAMMAKQGASMPGAGGAITSKLCITKEMAEQSQLPVQTQGDCTSTTTEKTRTSLKFKYVCTNPPSSGEGQYTFANDTTYTMNMLLKSPDKSKMQSITMDGSGKWLGSDCGTVKPIVMPKAAAAAKP